MRGADAQAAEGLLKPGLSVEPKGAMSTTGTCAGLLFFRLGTIAASDCCSPRSGIVASRPLLRELAHELLHRGQRRSSTTLTLRRSFAMFRYKTEGAYPARQF